VKLGGVEHAFIKVHADIEEHVFIGEHAFIDARTITTDILQRNSM
jgi:hypothetical protein